MSFQYSYTAVSSPRWAYACAVGLADGKLTREAFEGELEGNRYRQMVNEAQRQMYARCRGSCPGCLACVPIVIDWAGC